MYSAKFSKSFAKDLKKVSHEVQEVVLEVWVPKICSDPSFGRRFKGSKLDSFYKSSFRHKRNDYRIVYQINKKEVLVVFLAIGSRENFYARLNSRF